MKPLKANRLRVYHFGVTLIGIGLAFWVMVWVQEIRDTTDTNLRLTNCNQGLLTLATLDIWVEDKIKFCPVDLQTELRGKYS